MRARLRSACAFVAYCVLANAAAAVFVVTTFGTGWLS